MSKPDGLVLTDYPHDKLTRAAVKMAGAGRAAGAECGIILLSDAGEDGTCCLHPFGYEGPDKAGILAQVFVQVAEHLIFFGLSMGVKVDLLVNGKPMPEHPVFGGEGEAEDDGPARAGQ